MTTFDAGSGEVCTIRRIRTNTPLQALVTLNDPAFIEAAGALGRRMAGGPRRSDRDRVNDGFRAVLIRPPERPEVSRLLKLHETSRLEFQRDPAAAAALIESVSLNADSGEDPIDLAAWTVVGNVLLNLDETLTKP